MQKVYDFFGGRTMTLIVIGFVIGVVVVFAKPDQTMNYLAIYGATLGAQVVRAAAADKYVEGVKISNGKGGGAQ